MATINKFKVKRELYDKMADFVDSIDANINALEDQKAELEEKKANGEELRFWEESFLEEYPIKLEAYKTIKAHLEKLL